jgi:hypothetical protein
MKCCAKSVAAAQGPHLLFIRLPDNYREPLLEQPVVKLNGQRANKLPARGPPISHKPPLDLHYVRSTFAAAAITWNFMPKHFCNTLNYDKLL